MPPAAREGKGTVGKITNFRKFQGKNDLFSVGASCWTSEKRIIGWATGRGLHPWRVAPTKYFKIRIADSLISSLYFRYFSDIIPCAF
jgi:hypothetical protein